MSGLATAVREKLGISFESFADQVSEDESYQRLLATVAPE
jgi:carbamoylphosphate synthase large subunit